MRRGVSAVIALFSEIEGSSDWTKIEKINLGWSKDEKYYVETSSHQKMSLRVSDISVYEMKLKEYKIIQKYAKLGFAMSEPLSFGVFCNKEKVYMLLSWVEGVSLEEALPRLSETRQYQLGRDAGKILKMIHSIELPKAEMPMSTHIEKKLKQLASYEASSLRVPNDKDAVKYIKDNIHKIWSKPPVYQHGDFHPGNLILTADGSLGVIDFNRWDIGDPYEEFYKLESFGTEASIPYCIGQIDSYFDYNVPEDFWEILAVYVAHASLYSIVWAEKYGQKEIDNMTRICEKSMSHYDDFRLKIPSWYRHKR